jgi:VanZ family protein
MLLKLKTQFAPVINTPSYRFLRIIVAISYIVLLTLVLLQSSARPILGPSAPPEFNLGWEVLMTTAHLTGFGLLVLIIWSAMTTVTSTNRALVVAFLFACSLGLVTELLQTLVPDRGASLFDLACDCGIAFTVAYLIRRQMRNTV